MNRVALLEALKAETEVAVGDLLLPVAMQQGDKEKPKNRAAKVYLMRLPDGKAATKKVPYIIHQVLTGKDQQPPGKLDESSTAIRSIFAVYNKDEQEGGLALLGLMERLRIHLLRTVIIGEGQFELDKEAGLEILVYPDDHAPYFAGEMSTVWKCPAVEREVSQYL